MTVLTENFKQLHSILLNYDHIEKKEKKKKFYNISLLNTFNLTTTNTFGRNRV